MLIYPYLSCEIQIQLTKVFDLYHATSRVSLNSISSFIGSSNTKEACTEFCQGLYQIGVTADMISQNERAIHNIFKSQVTAISSQIDGVTVQDKSQLPIIGGSEISPIYPKRSISTEFQRPWFGWDQPPIDFLVGPMMLAAAEAGDTKRLISTLGYIQNIDFEDDGKETALHKAAQNGYTNIAELLLGKGASIEAMDTYNKTPFHRAVQSGHAGVVGLFLEKGALTKRDNGAFDFLVGPMMLAAAGAGDTKLLVSTLRFIRNIEFEDGGKETALHKAAQNGFADIAELLIGKGASIEVMDTYNNTPLHRAVKNGHTGVAELLLEKGAPIEAMNKGNNTALHLVAWSGHTDIAKLLLGRGASTEAMNNLGNTPLHRAVRNGHTGVVELLLDKGAPIEAINEDSNTALHLAAVGGYTEEVVLLLGKGASVKAINIYNNTPLHLAAGCGHTVVVDLLLRKDASIEAMNKYRRTPLDLAKMSNHTKTVKLLKNNAVKPVHGNSA